MAWHEEIPEPRVRLDDYFRWRHAIGGFGDGICIESVYIGGEEAKTLCGAILKGPGWWHRTYDCWVKEENVVSVYGERKVSQDMGLEINIEIDEFVLRRLVLEYLQKQMGSNLISENDIKIEVKTSKNYNPIS